MIDPDVFINTITEAEHDMILKASKGGPMALIDDNRLYFFFDGKIRRTRPLGDGNGFYINNKRATFSMSLILQRVDVKYNKKKYRYRLVRFEEFAIEMNMLGYKHMFLDIEGQTWPNDLHIRLIRAWLPLQQKTYILLDYFYTRDRILWSLYYSGSKTSYIDRKLKEWAIFHESSKNSIEHNRSLTMEAVISGT